MESPRTSSAISDDVAKRNRFCRFDGLYRLSSGDATQQRQPIVALFCRACGQHVDGPAAIVRSLQQALVLQIGDVFVDSGERVEPEAVRNFLVGRRVPVLLSEAGEEVDYFFLPPCDGHGLHCSE
jgi:hypothetical protein